MRLRTSGLLTVLMLLVGGGVNAHHSHGPFYHLDQVVEITGVVNSFRLINPHPELLLEVTSPDGETEEVMVYAQAYAGQMREVGGWTDESVRVGDTVTAVGHPGRGSVTSVMGQTLTNADGEVLDMRFFDRHGGLADLRLHLSPSSPLMSLAVRPPILSCTRAPVVMTSTRASSSALGASAQPTSMASKWPRT